MGGFLVFRYTMVSLVWMHLTLCASLAKKGVEPVVEAAASDDQSPKRRQRKGGKLVFPEDVTAWSDREDSAVPSDGLGDKTDDWALLRNSKTGWFHRAVKVGDDDQWCRPAVHELSCRSTTPDMTLIHALVAVPRVDIPVAETPSLRPGPKCLRWCQIGHDVCRA